MTQPLNPTPALEAFLCAEIRNEDHGGESPTTLFSAMDSLYQISQESLREMNAGTSEADRAQLMLELQNLIEVMGGECQVAASLQAFVAPPARC
jgi:hypothetical protein